MAYHRKEQKMSKVGIAVSIALHAAVIAILVLLAAREGMLGKHLKKIAVTMVPRELPLEKPKETPKLKPLEKPPELKSPEAEPAKIEAPQLAKTPPTVQPAQPVAVPPPTTASSVAPPPAAMPGFLFGGSKTVENSSDPKALYKGFVEYTLRSNWKRPDNLADLDYTAEVEVGIDRAGQLTGSEWKKGSGSPAWDNSVRHALAQTKSLGRTPPMGFPEKVLVRFDVRVEADALKP
jgi:outer membrane biosynthesis protein TonB